MDGCMADALQIYKDMARQVRGGGEMGSGWGEVGWITDLHAPTLTLSLPRLQAIHAGHLSSHVTTLAVPSPHTQAAENHLLRFSCKQYLQAAGLCRLAQGDLSTLQDAMKTYYDIDVTFGGSREAKFIEDLLAACLEGDEDKFTQVGGGFGVGWGLGGCVGVMHVRGGCAA